MTDLQLQTTPEQRAELARLAGEATPGPWRVDNNEVSEHVPGVAMPIVAHIHYRFDKYDPGRSERNGKYIAYADPTKIAALLSDRDALEAECQRLRERAEVAEKAVELASAIAPCSHCTVDYDEECYLKSSSHLEPEQMDKCVAYQRAIFMKEARAALGVAPEPQ